MLWLILGRIADFIGIASFVLTIVLLIKSETLRNEILSQKKEYISHRKEIIVKLEALRANIWEGQPITLRIVSNIRTLLFSFKQKFGRLLKWRDLYHLHLTLNMLKKDLELINASNLCTELDYFIARFERMERNEYSS